MPLGTSSFTPYSLPGPCRPARVSAPGPARHRLALQLDALAQILCLLRAELLVGAALVDTLVEVEGAALLRLAAARERGRERHQQRHGQGCFRHRRSCLF